MATETILQRLFVDQSYNMLRPTIAAVAFRFKAFNYCLCFSSFCVGDLCLVQFLVVFLILQSISVKKIALVAVVAYYVCGLFVLSWSRTVAFPGHAHLFKS